MHVERYPEEDTRFFNRRVQVAAESELELANDFARRMKKATIILTLVSSALLGLFADLKPVTFIAAVAVLSAATVGIFSHVEQHITVARSRLARLRH